MYKTFLLLLFCLVILHFSGFSQKFTQFTQEPEAYFEEIVPEYDKDRVYVSDIKKVILWYNTLQEKEMLDFTETEEEDEGKSANEESVKSEE